MQVVGGITGSKTISKIGMGFSIAGGVGLGASSLAGMSSTASGAASVTGSVSRGSGLLSAADDAATVGSSAKAASQGLKTFSASKGASSADKFKASADSIGVGSLNPGTNSFDPELEKSYFQRASNTLTSYNPMMNMLGGMGEAYMMNERMNLDKSINDKRINIDQQALDLNKQKQNFLMQNNSVPLNINPAINLTRDTSAYSGLLGR